MLLTARKTEANNRSSLLPTCTESPILCHTAKSNNRSVVAISFRLRYHINSPDISPSVNLASARSANSTRLFCADFSNTDTVEPIRTMFTPPRSCLSRAAWLTSPAGSPLPSLAAVSRRGHHNAEFQHPCRDRNDSHTLIQCTVDSIYCSTCVVIYTFHICARDHAYSDRLQTQITCCSHVSYSLMIGNYALTPTATGSLHVLEHILFLLTHIMCTIRTSSIVILSCPFQRPVQLC